MKRTFKILTMVAVIAALVVPVQALAVNARIGKATQTVTARKVKAPAAAARLAKLKAQLRKKLAKRKNAFNRAASALQLRIDRVRARAVTVGNTGADVSAALASPDAAQTKLDAAKTQQAVAVAAYDKVFAATTIAGARAALKAARGEDKKTGQLLKDARNSVKAAIDSLKATAGA
jgi:hypothetical protein